MTNPTNSLNVLAAKIKQFFDLHSIDPVSGFMPEDLAKFIMGEHRGDAHSVGDEAGTAKQDAESSLPTHTLIAHTCGGRTDGYGGFTCVTCGKYHEANRGEKLVKIDDKYELGAYWSAEESAGGVATQDINCKEHFGKVQVHGDNAKEIAATILRALNIEQKREERKTRLNDDETETYARQLLFRVRNFLTSTEGEAQKELYLAINKFLAQPVREMVARVPKDFPYPSSVLTSLENYRRILDWLYIPSNLIEGDKPVRESVTGWPDLREETQAVLTWAHNIAMCCENLPEDNKATFPIVVWYLRALRDVVKEFEKAQSDRILNYAKNRRNHIEDGK